MSLGARLSWRSVASSAPANRPAADGGRYGGLRLDQATRLKELERENTRPQKLVANQALDNAILKEVTSGPF